THYAMTEPPRFEGGLEAVASGTAESVDRLLRVGWDVRRGAVATDEPPLLVVCPTVADPGRAPNGHHTLKVIGFHPYDLADGGPGRWAMRKATLPARTVNALRANAPTSTTMPCLARGARARPDPEQWN